MTFQQQRQTSNELPDKALRAACPWNRERQVIEQLLPLSAETQLCKQVLSETVFHFPVLGKPITTRLFHMFASLQINPGAARCTTQTKFRAACQWAQRREATLV